MITTGLFLIRTNGGYWRPDAAGYTTSERAAGRYTREEAEAHIKGLGPEKHDVGVRLSQLSEALLVWAMMRGQSGAHPTVAAAMLDFNTTQAVIEEAIGDGHWLYLTGEGVDARIGVDGE